MVHLSNRVKIVLFMVLVVSLVSPCFIYAASAQNTTVTAEANSNQLNIGETLTVNIKISDAVDLYGLAVTLSWNTSVLEAISATNALGVESHSNGVLHESQSYPLQVEQDGITDSQYTLLATSTGSTTPSFDGSGTIATVVFNVTGSGSAGLALDVELSVRNSNGDVSLSTPATRIDAINAVPEFPTVALIVALAVAAAASVVVATKLRKPNVSIAKNPDHF